MDLEILKWDRLRAVECGWERIHSEIERRSAELAEWDVVVRCDDLVAVRTESLPLEIRWKMERERGRKKKEIVILWFV